MVTDIKVDFTLLKTVLFKVIEEKKGLFSSDENVVFQTLYDQYEHKSGIDVNNLSCYKNIFADYFANICKSIAKYRSDGSINYATKQIHEAEKAGELFRSDVFNALKRQLFLEMKLLNEEHQIAISIITKLAFYMGNSYYFEAKCEILESLFSNAIMLYLSNSICNEPNGEEAKSIITSMKRLLNLHNLKFDIIYGDIYFNDDSEKIIQSKIESLIKNIGGINFLKFLFSHEICPKYNNLIDRFLIHRNKHQVGLNIEKLRVPYNYLIQLAAKHIQDKEVLLLTKNGQKEKYIEAIRISEDYLNVLNLQSYSILGDMVWDYKTIPKKLCQNIYFEKMFTPIQYNPHFVIRFLNEIYFPFFKNAKNIGYTSNEYLKLCEVILKEKRVCVTYTLAELKKSTKLKQTTLKNILDDVSIQYDKVNMEYSNFLAKTNYRLKPLINLKDNTYFLFSAHFNGFAFCEVLYHKLKSYYQGDFNKLKGEYLENLVKHLFNEKGFCFHSGKYVNDIGITFECDMILENEKQIVFIEIKNQPLLDGFESGDDVETLYYLGKGMIKAQKQCYNHIKHLKSKQKLIINEEDGTKYELTEKDRQIICISVCSQEYLFLSNKSFSEPFLQSLLVATYHATDPNKEKRLNDFNALRDELEQLVIDIYGTENIRSNKAFFNTLFRSAQQIFTILTVSKTLDDFIYYLTQPIHFNDGSGDVYHQLLTSMEMKENN